MITIGETVAYIGSPRESVVEDRYVITAVMGRYLWAVGAEDGTTATLTCLEHHECSVLSGV